MGRAPPAAVALGRVTETIVSKRVHLVSCGSFHSLAVTDLGSVYEWGGKISKRFFCKACGTHCFGRGHLAEVGGDYVSFSYNAVDDFEVSELSVVHWDGRHNNWQAGPAAKPYAMTRSARVFPLRVNIAASAGCSATQRPA